MPYMAPAHSGVTNSALSAAGMSSRVSRRVDVSPEHLQTLPDDLEVSVLSRNGPVFSRKLPNCTMVLLMLPCAGYLI